MGIIYSSRQSLPTITSFKKTKEKGSFFVLKLVRDKGSAVRHSSTLAVYVTSSPEHQRQSHEFTHTTLVDLPAGRHWGKCSKLKLNKNISVHSSTKILSGLDVQFTDNSFSIKIHSSTLLWRSALTNFATFSILFSNGIWVYDGEGAYQGLCVSGWK